MIVGLDVGGTHTDVVLLNDEGLVNEVKVPTDAADLFNSVLAGLEKVTAGTNPQDIHRVVLSTTLTTNAIVENKIPPVAMVVTAGPGIDPELFRTNPYYYVVSGAVDHRGREIDPVNEQEIRAIAEKIKTEGIRYAGVVGKFSIRNPSHEQTISNILKASLERVFMGHQISGMLNFPRRIATTYLNAAVYPIHRKFYAAIKNSLAARGLDLPIRILKADGGNMRFDASIDFPGQTILSGPAASVMGSLAFAPDDKDSLVLDIGGTTTDMAILVNRVPLLDPLGITMGSYQTLIRALDTHSIGMGGDSHVVCNNGHLKIGPERRGPAMAYGGPVPTPTDALFLISDMGDGRRENSVRGITPIAAQLGITLENAARSIFRLTCEGILREARKMIQRVNSKPVYTVHEILEGYSVSPKKILVLGGPAPFFAREFEKESDLEIRVVPRWSVANAIGAALARTTCEVVLFVDTEKGTALAPNENFGRNIPAGYSNRDAIDTALTLLRQKALKQGANPEHLEMEVIENMQFNMVRGFHTSGKNMRIRAQVKPGLIHGQDRLLRNISLET